MLHNKTTISQEKPLSKQNLNEHHVKVCGDLKNDMGKKNPSVEYAGVVYNFTGEAIIKIEINDHVKEYGHLKNPWVTCTAN